MTYRIRIVYGSMVSRAFTVTADDRVSAIHAASGQSLALGLPPVAFWQPPRYYVDEVVERPRSTEPLRVLKRGVAA